MSKLNESERELLESYHDFKNKYPNLYKKIAWIGITLIVVPMLIWFVYFIGDCGYVLIYTSLEVGDALGFYGSFLSFLGTVVLGALAIWQIDSNRKKDILHNHKIQLEFCREMYNVEVFRIESSKSEYWGDSADNYFKIKNEKSRLKVLYINFEFKSVNGNIPDKFRIERISIGKDYSFSSILNDNLTNRSNYKLIINKQNPFKCSIMILDDNLTEFENLESMFFNFDIEFLKEINKYHIATKYNCVTKLDYKKNIGSYEQYTARAHNELIHQIKGPYFINIITK